TTTSGDPALQQPTNKRIAMVGTNWPMRCGMSMLLIAGSQRRNILTGKGVLHAAEQFVCGHCVGTNDCHRLAASVERPTTRSRQRQGRGKSTGIRYRQQL